MVGDAADGDHGKAAVLDLPHLHSPPVDNQPLLYSPVGLSCAAPHLTSSRPNLLRTSRMPGIVAHDVCVGMCRMG